MLDSGYAYITLDGWTPNVNPTEYLDPHAVKKFVDVVTLTATVTQHWAVQSSDKTIWLKWNNLSKADKDTLITKYEADYTSYVFTDIYGTSYNVVMVDMPTPQRRTTLDSDGFMVELLLKVV